MYRLITCTITQKKIQDNYYIHNKQFQSHVEQKDAYNTKYFINVCISLA